MAEREASKRCDDNPVNAFKSKSQIFRDWTKENGGRGAGEIGRGDEGTSIKNLGRTCWVGGKKNNDPGSDSQFHASGGWGGGK